MPNTLSYLQILLYSTIAINSLNANELLLNDCLSEGSKEEMGCSIANILETHTQTFRIREEESLTLDIPNNSFVNITETLSFVKVKHEKKELIIKRTSKEKEHSCPPFCIQPMNIENVKTVGELEVLKFIEVLKKKKPKLLIDARSKPFAWYGLRGTTNFKPGV